MAIPTNLPLAGFYLHSLQSKLWLAADETHWTGEMAEAACFTNRDLAADIAKREENPHHGDVVILQLGTPDEADEPEGDPGQRGPCPGHKWVYTGTAYGGDDTSYHGEGRAYCEHCGADGDA